MKTQLPAKLKNLCFFAKGKFFLNGLSLELTDTGFVQQNAFVERISKFNLNDLQARIEESYGKDVLLFSEDIDFKRNPDWSYIKREQTLEKESFRVLSNVYGSPNILAIVVDFLQINLFMFSSKDDSLEGRTEKIDLEGIDSSVLNNFLFDPFVSFERPSPLEGRVLQAFSKLLKDAKPVVDMVVLMGEYIWTNNCESFVSKLNKELLGKDSMASSFGLLIDENGLWEGVLSELPIESELKYLNKKNFERNIICVQKVSSKSKFEVASNQSDTANREIICDEDDWDYVLLNDLETYQGKKYKGLLIGGGDNIKNFPIVKKKVGMRKDFTLEYFHRPLKIILNADKTERIKIFDYSTPNPFDRLILDVVEGEMVEKGQKLGKYNEIGGLMGKSFVSPIKGAVDLSCLKNGYILVESSGKADSRMFKNYSKLRARMVLGNSYDGSFDEDGIFVSNLYKTDFEMLIQKGKKLVVVDSIERKLFYDIVDFDLSKLITIVLLGGIDIPTKSNSRKSILKGSYISYTERENEIMLAKEDRGEPFTSSKENILRVGHELRIIDPHHWGEYARIVSTGKEKISVKTTVGVDQIETINLI